VAEHVLRLLREASAEVALPAASVVAVVAALAAPPVAEQSPQVSQYSGSLFRQPRFFSYLS
jgi:hypothetical protein